MHILGIRRTLADKHPWLPVAAMKAFEHAKTRALAKLTEVATSKVLPSRTAFLMPSGIETR